MISVLFSSNIQSDAEKFYHEYFRICQHVFL